MTNDIHKELCDETRGGMATIVTTIVGAIIAFALLAVTCGCKYFYENAGSHTRVGSLVAPVEVSEPSDSITVRALYSMDGADVYTAKDSLVKIKYRNSYTNNYFAIVKTEGVQDLEVEIEPLAVDGGDEPQTNQTHSAQASATIRDEGTLAP